MADAAPPPAELPSEPSSSTAPEAEAELPSNASPTLYIQNLNEKVKNPIMKATLENLFSNYGKVLSVVAHTNVRMRGQAFVSLDSPDVADKARREAHLFPLYGKAMKITFANTKSDSVIQSEQEEGVESEAFKQHKQDRLEQKKIARRGNVLRRRELERKIRAKRTAAGEIAEVPQAPTAKRPQQDMPDEYLPPNKILFLQKIPEGVGKGELESLFSAYVLFIRLPSAQLTYSYLCSNSYAGYVDVQTIPGKADIAFVEFADITSSVTARSALNNHNFGAADKLKVGRNSSPSALLSPATDFDLPFLDRLPSQGHREPSHELWTESHTCTLRLI